MKKRIGLYLAARRIDGGVYQYCQSILCAFAALPADEFDSIVFCAERTWDQQVAALGLEHRKVRLSLVDRALAYVWIRVGLPVKLWRLLIAPLHGLCRKLRGAQCDLWIFPAQDRWSYLAPVPAMGVILDLMHRYQRRFPEFSESGLYRLRENHYTAMCNWTQAILVDSECGRNQVHESYELERDRILPLPLVIPPELRELSTKDVQLKMHLPPKFLFYPAQFWPHKNHARLIQALRRGREKYPDMAFVFTGAKTRLYSTLQQLTHELRLDHAVHFVGYVDAQEMRVLYRRARALVMPSFFGPTNTPPIEALALGCPAAVSDLYAMPQQVGDAGLTFDPESVEEIQSVMERLWSDDALCRTLRNRGLERSKTWGEHEFADVFSANVRHAVQLPPRAP